MSPEIHMDQWPPNLSESSGLHQYSWWAFRISFIFSARGESEALGVGEAIFLWEIPGGVSRVGGGGGPRGREGVCREIGAGGGGGGANLFFSGRNSRQVLAHRVAISVAIYRRCRGGPGQTAKKQPEKQPKHPKNTRKTAVLTFLGVSDVFPAVFRLFDRDPLGTFFGCFSGCFQCRAFGTSVDGHRDCNHRVLFSAFGNHRFVNARP